MKILTITILLFMLSCGGLQQNSYMKLENKLLVNDYLGAIKLIKADKENYGEYNKVLYYMNLGWLYHLSGSLIDTHASLKKASDYIDDLFTKSASANFSSKMMNNNNMLPFEGEDFEKIAVSIVKALDYAYHNKFEDAVIEARKINEDLKFFNKEREVKTAYQEDAFGRYLAGILYESQHEYSNAYISYHKAYKAYREYNKHYRVSTPSYLRKALKRLMPKYASSADIDFLQRELADVITENSKNKGRFVFVHYNGFAPKKEENSKRLYPRDYDPNSTYQNRILLEYPVFKIRKHRISYAKVYINNTIYRTELVQPIDRIAIRDLKDRLIRDFPRMIATKLLRMKTEDTLKNNSTRKVCRYNRYTRKRDCEYRTRRNSNKSFGWGNVAAMALKASSDKADLRSWRLLPAEIQLADIILDPGVYNIKIEYCDNNGYTLQESKFDNVTIEKNKETFKWYRTVR